MMTDGLVMLTDGLVMLIDGICNVGKRLSNTTANVVYIDPLPRQEIRSFDLLGSPLGELTLPSSINCYILRISPRRVLTVKLTS